MSRHSPGFNGEPWSLMRKPRALNPAGKLARVPASTNWRNVLVAVRLRLPNKCTSPNP